MGRALDPSSILLTRTKVMTVLTIDIRTVFLGQRKELGRNFDFRNVKT